MDIRFDIRVPIYRQLADLLKEQIETGIYKPGQQIPPESRFCEEYGISRVTVRKAIEILTEEGILVKQQGKGTFVAVSMIVESSNAKGSFTMSCRQNNVEPSTHFISCGPMAATGAIGKELNLQKDEHIICIKRLRCANGVPVIFETDYIASSEHSYLLGADLENTSLLEVMKKNSNLIYSGFEDVLDVRYADEEQAEYLNCKRGTPVLGVYQKVFAQNNKILYINDQVILSERYKYTSLHIE